MNVPEEEKGRKEEKQRALVKLLCLDNSRGPCFFNTIPESSALDCLEERGRERKAERLLTHCLWDTSLYSCCWLDQKEPFRRLRRGGFTFEVHQGNVVQASSKIIAFLF